MRVLRFLILFLLLAPVLPAWAESVAMSQLRTTVDAVLEVLRKKDVPLEQRKQMVSGAIHQRFDFSLMARSALGPSWNTLTPDQQRRYSQVFSDLLETTYLNRIDAYSDESVRYLKEEERAGKVMVETEVVGASRAIPIHYKLLSDNGQWQVYDIVIENVSLVRNYRTTYGEILGRDGFDGMLARMEQKLAALRSGAEKE